MKVILTSKLATPQGVRFPGEEIDLPEYTAKNLIQRGNARDAASPPEPADGKGNS